MAAAGLAVTGAGAAVALLMMRVPGQAHVLSIPARLGAFVRRPQLEQQMNVRQLRQQVIAKSDGQASHVVSAVYENGGGVPGAGQPQIMLFIGGNLTGVSPAAFIASFTSQFNGARAASPGPMGGSASCVSARAGAPSGIALCTWADDDTFGVIASPSLGFMQLSAQMRAIRPLIEHTAR
jgi:hypothetical protein